MRISAWTGAALVLFAGAVVLAQQPVSPYEEVVVEILKSLERTTKLLAKIEDPATAGAATAPLKEAVARFVKARDKAVKLKLPDMEEKNRVAKKYAPKVAEWMRKFKVEYRRAKGIPGTAPAIAELKPLLEAPNDAKKSKAKDKKNN